MKNSLLKKLALIMAIIMITASFAACGGGESSKSSGASSSSNVSQGSEVSGDDENKSEDGVLSVGYDYFSNKFSPFFWKTAYDNDVAKVTGVYLLDYDREGGMLLNSSKGETVAYDGTDYTYEGIADGEVVQNDDGSVDYNITMRDDIKFSDGTPMTIDDAIFSLYVMLDPTYDGAATLYSMPIVGLDEYRSGVEKLSVMIIMAGRDNTDFTNFTQEQQEAYWAAVDKAGPMFAQDIVDYCVANYEDKLESVGNSEVALGMYGWGFGSPSEDGKTITGSETGTVYDTATVTVEDYWTEILTKYGGETNLQEISDSETANTDLFTFIAEVLGDDAETYDKGISTGDSAANVTGIVKTGDYSMTVTLSQFDATAIYNFQYFVAPLHYYGSADEYDYDNNKFGFTKGDLSGVKSKTTQPLGAGPYVFESFENGVITFTANTNYYKGEPKISTMVFRETTDADKLSGTVSGSFDIANPAMSVSVMKDIKKYNSNGEKDGDVITTELYDFLGYGYIGMNANNVKVGSDKASEESKNLRTAFATIFAAYRDTVINSYYGELASVIQYPMSNTSWASPKPADEGYTTAFSKDIDGNDIYTDIMTDEEKYEAALQAAVGYFKAAGYTYDEASGKFTAAPAGAEMTYEVLIPGDGIGDHPSFGILTAAKEALDTIGITLEINDLSDSSVLWTKTESGTNVMWVAAWGATADPDLYQVYHSTNVVGEGGTDSNHYAIQDETLDQLIISARDSADQTFRKATYKEALDVIIDWAVEVPIYQRQDAFIFSTERVNMDTVTPDITPFYQWFKEIENFELN